MNEKCRDCENQVASMRGRIISLRREIDLLKEELREVYKFVPNARKRELHEKFPHTGDDLEALARRENG